MSIGKRIRQLRLQNQYSQEYVAKQIDSTKQAVYKYENEIVTNIPTDKIEKMAALFGVSPSFLLGWEDEWEAGELPFGLRPVRTRRFPMLGDIACGQPIYADQDHESYVDAGAEIDADFCLTAKGDSMIGARIRHGDVVFIKKMPIVNNGEIAAVVIGEEATLKRWYYYPEQKKLILNPENAAYEPMLFLGEELEQVRCLGKAVCFISGL